MIAGALACSTIALLGQSARSDAEWPWTVGDAAGTKYSPLDQINRETVKDLRIGWRWKTENFGARPDFNLEATPIMLGGVLYTSAGLSRNFVAIDGRTGETLWTYRSPDDASRGAGGVAPSGRGVAYWRNGRDERILGVTRGYNLVALDAKTGRPVDGFGVHGTVDLLRDFDQHIGAGTVVNWSGPPLVIGNTVVVGTGGVGNRVAGHLRGYDIRTGRRIWIFHTLPQPGQVGADTWEKDATTYIGRAGVWSQMTADEELGYIYVPLDSPGEMYFGGNRLGDNLFGESLVCINAKTGTRVWHFQTVRHGVWDYDLPAPPNLIDIVLDGQPRKLVAQVSKQGFVYVLDRVTGKPVWPIEDRAVPSETDVPGERLSKTQPFPTKPAAFEKQGLTTDDLIDFTPALRAEAIKIISEYKYGPLFTPPIVAGAHGLKATISVPGGSGGANWEGAAFDPETGMLYIPSFTQPTPLALAPRPVDNVGAPAYRGAWAWGPEGPEGLPLMKPPYSRITAIDMHTGNHAWMVPSGDTPEFVRNHPALKGIAVPRTGSGNRSGVLVTKTLLFVGEGSGMMSAPSPKYGGSTFHALDKRTGENVAAIKLPGRQSGNPMAYAIGGRQFIVVPIGGPDVPSELVALTLR